MATLLLCQRMQKKFPRELRDLVYRYVLPADNVRVWLPDLERRRATPTLFYLWWTEHDGPENVLKTPAPYNLQKNIGQKTSDELLEYFYRHTRFDFGKQFELFVQNTDDSTWTTLIRKISVSMFCVESLWGLSNDWERDRILKLLKPLCTWSTSLDLTIFLFVEPLPTPGMEIGRKILFSDIIEKVFPMLRQLRNAGHAVSVILNPSSEIWKDTSYNDPQFAGIIRTDRFTHIFNPQTAEFSPEGFLEKLLEYDQIASKPETSFNKRYGTEWSVTGL